MPRPPESSSTRRCASAREEAAGRLSRELDRAVETFVRQADAVFAERLAQTGDAGQQRLEQRQRQAQAAFERQRDELVASFQERVAAADAELRRMLGAFAAEAEAERAAIAKRLAELYRRVDEASARAGPRHFLANKRTQGTSLAARTRAPWLTRPS